MLEEFGSTALLLAVFVAGVLIGCGFRGLALNRDLSDRVSDLEREMHRLRAEVARIDASAVLWHSPPATPAPIEPDIA